MRMITPTSKNTGTPTMKPAIVSASGVRRLPKRVISVLASASAPPESSMIRPIIAPRAMMIAIWPKVLPMPPSMVATRSAGFTPATSATRMLTSIKATKGWNLYLSTRNNNRAIPSPAVTIRINGLISETLHAG
ncbi:hypothetical protein D3C73_884300 [compost metagenome]